jgi:hypothetical protein
MGHESMIRKQVIDRVTHVLESRKLGNEKQKRWKSKCKVILKVKIITLPPR